MRSREQFWTENRSLHHPLKSLLLTRLPCLCPLSAEGSGTVRIVVTIIVVIDLKRRGNHGMHGSKTDSPSRLKFQPCWKCNHAIIWSFPYIKMLWGTYSWINGAFQHFLPNADEICVVGIKPERHSDKRRNATMGKKRNATKICLTAHLMHGMFPETSGKLVLHICLGRAALVTRDIPLEWVKIRWGFLILLSLPIWKWIASALVLALTHVNLWSKHIYTERLSIPFVSLFVSQCMNITLLPLSSW